MGSVVLNGATSGATTITPTDGVTATLTLPSTTGSLGLSTGSATQSFNAQNTFGFKNRIINGGMTISQRGTSPTITGGGEYSVDRYLNYYSGDAYTSVQSTTAPAGFINSLLLTVTTASASPTYSFFGQRIEGLNCADLNFGTSSALAVTLSFWVRSSIIGIYSIALSNANGDRSYAAQYTISVANTWEQKTITISGDTSGTWLTTNGIGIFIRWCMGTSSSGRLISAGSWQAANADGATGSTGANTWANSSGATFYITGVQLEVGTQATSFDFRDYGRELILCQRYYETNFSGVAVPSVNYYGYVTYGLGTQTLFGGSSTNQQIYGQVYFCVVKRATPTISIYGYASNTLTSCSGGWSGNDLGAGTGTLNTAAKDGFSLYNSTGSNVTSNGYGVIFNFAASAEL